MEESNKKPSKTSKNTKDSKKPKLIIKTINKNGELTNQEMSSEDMEKLGEGLMEALDSLKEQYNSEQKENKINKSLSIKEEYVEERTKQELETQEHEVQRRKLFTLFDVITNTKELLIQRVGEHGKADLQHNIADTTKTAANNVINNCLKQVFLWVEKNDINKTIPKKPTNPEDIIGKDLFK